MTHTTRSVDTDRRQALRVAALALGADLRSRHGKTFATLCRADAVRRETSTGPVTLDVRFKSGVAGQPGPTIGEVLASVG